MKKLLLVLLGASIAVTSAFAQEPAEDAPGKCPEKAAPAKPHPGKQFFDAYKQLKEKYPEQIAEIEKLRKDAWEKNKQADEKFRELAEK